MTADGLRWTMLMALFIRCQSPIDHADGPFHQVTFANLVIDHADGPFHQVTRANLAGFGIVVCGLLMYHVIQWRDEQRWRRDERYEEGRRDERYEGRRDERYEERWRRDERYEEGYEGGGDTIASVAAAEEEAAKAKGRYEGAVSAA